MRAINLPFFKSKLRDLSRKLFIEHGWQIPNGLRSGSERDTLNYGLAEWQTAKRTKADPRYLKAVFIDCWERSDDQQTFSVALGHHNIKLARGDQRGLVAVDQFGNVYSVSRWVGQKAKAVRAKLSEWEALPSVETVKDRLPAKCPSTCKEVAHPENDFEISLRSLRLEQRRTRDQLREHHRIAEFELARHHQSILPKGFRALWFRVTGQHAIALEAFESDYRSLRREQDLEREDLFQRQLLERQKLQLAKRPTANRCSEPSSRRRTQRGVPGKRNRS